MLNHYLQINLNKNIVIIRDKKIRMVEAKDCEIISEAEYESLLNDQITKLEDQFSILSQEIQVKKDACVEICRKHPKISYESSDRL